MFENFAGSDDGAVVAAIEESARVEAAAGARRLAAIAELVARRVEPDGDERWYWACDSWDSAAAEVAAALNIGHRAASGLMHQALALRDRLPAVAALYHEGHLSSRLVSVLTWRTQLVEDAEALALIDAGLAQAGTRWGPLSAHKLEQAIDVLVERHDPGARRRTRIAARDRHVSIGNRDDVNGTTSLWGRLLATDAALLERRLTQMIHGVCDEDARTTAQRRADALGALAAGAAQLACTCGSPDCPTRGEADPRAEAVVIHVLAESDTLTARPDPQMSGDDEPAREQRPCESAPAAPPAVMLGGMVLPAPLLAELAARGAKVQPVAAPDARSGYRPSTALSVFARLRDMTCRWPGCDRPAQFTDIDHTTPYPGGPTHPSNNKCYCRKHHLLKTFWCGPSGWSDRQLADGTVIVTSPTGRTYTTHPGCRIFFPTWNITTADLPPPAEEAPSAGRGLMMPRRKRTRAADHAQRIKRERALNDAYVAERNKPPPL